MSNCCHCSPTTFWREEVEEIREYFKTQVSKCWASFLSFWQQCVPRDHYRLYYLQPYNIKGRGQPAQGDVGAVGEDGEENWVVCWGGRGGGGGQLLGGGRLGGGGDG